MGNLSKNFSKKEFACKCGCGYDDVDPKLILHLEKLRKMMGRPLKITSGCRCSDHNNEVGGANNSPHLRGKAADVAVLGGADRMELVGNALVWFDRIGVAKSFLHVDVDESLPQDVLWTY